MTRLHTLLTTAALIGFAALPAAALDLNAKTTLLLGLGNHDGKIGAAVKDKIQADIKDGGLDDGSGDGVIDVSSKFVGNPVMTKDGVLVGHIEKVFVSTTGENRIWVVVDRPNDLKVDHFIIVIDPRTEADGTVNLAWTQAELNAAIQAQIAANKG